MNVKWTIVRIIKALRCNGFVDGPNSAGSFYALSYYTLLWKTCFKCPPREIHSPKGYARNRASGTGYRAHSQNALRAYSLLRAMVSPLFTGRPFTKPHVPCVASNRKLSLLAALFCSLTGVHFVLLICQIFMQALNLSRSSMTRELLHKKIPWLSPGY